MTTKITYNCETGEAEEIEMVGDELAAYEVQQAFVPLVPPSPPTTPADILDAVAQAIETARTPAEQAAAIREMAAALRGAP